MIEVQLELNVDQNCASWFTCLSSDTKHIIKSNLNQMATIFLSTLCQSNTLPTNDEKDTSQQASVLQQFCGVIIDHMTHTKQSCDEETMRYKAQIEEQCEKDVRAQYQEALIGLKAQNDILKNQTSAQVNDAIMHRIETVENDLRRKLEEKERALSELQKGQVEEWRNVHANVVEMETRWEKFCGTKNVGSSSKGKTAELIYHDLLADLFPKCELYRVAQVSHSGDFHLMHAATPYMRRYGIVVELKNYTQTVPSPQIQKFHHDVTAIHRFEHMQGVEVMHGILISIDSGIAGKDTMQVEIIKDKHILVYLPRHLCDTVTLSCAVKVISHIHKYLSTVSRDNGIVMVRIDEEKKTQLMKHLNDMLRDQSTLRQNLQASLKLVDDKYITNIMRLISECSTV